MCHVTGGGLPGNLPRVLPDGLGARICGAWSRPPIFGLIEARGPVDESEMRRTFNDGIGYVFVVPRGEADKLRSALVAIGEAPIDMGHVVRVPPETEFEARVMYGPAAPPRGGESPR
jgi:phosphoribosylformylglycinamidine cyclo-ligase